MIEALALNAADVVGLAGVRTTTEVTARPAAVSTPKSFDSVLGDVAVEAMNTLRSGEAAAISGLEGKASAQQVVEAVMSAERTLQLAAAVRDKVVAAYQEVSRMAI